MEPSIDWGIYRTHPPGRERAESLESFMKTYSIPIRRSMVTSSFKTTVQPGEKASLDILFGKRKLFTLGGSAAIARSDDAVEKLNAFFDSQPQMFEMTVTDDGWVMGRRQGLLKLEPEDAAAADMGFDAYRADALKQMRAAIFTLSYRIWNSR